MTTPKPKRVKRRLPWWAWVLIAAGSIVGVIALLGGFNEVPIEKLPTVELGEEFAGNEVALQVDDIYLTRAEPVTGYEADEGEVYLVVEATAENVTTGPNLFLNRAVRVLVEGVVSGEDEPEVVLDLRTGDNVSYLQPGLPLRVAYLWEIEEHRIDPGEEIFVGIFERYAVPDDLRFDDYRSPPVPVVRLVEKVGDFR